MRPTRANWNKLFEQSDQQIWLVDASWYIVLTNPALRAWWGEGGEELAGQEVRFAIAAAGNPSAKPASALAPDPAVFTGRAVQAKIIHPHEPAQTLDVQWLPLLDAAGEVAAAIAWGTKAAAPEPVPPPRITAATDWHALLAEHRARTRGEATLNRFVGASLAMQTLRARADLAARQGSHAWIFGPAGSGRRTLARTIHALGADAEAPFAEWDAATLTPELWQQQLRHFHSAPRIAPLSSANAASTTVLISNAQHLAEASFAELKPLQESTKVRFLFTSNCAPHHLPQPGLLPKPLLAAWSALTIEVPPLGTRTEDLPLLVQQIVEDQNLAGEKQLRGCSLAALELLAAYRWPGDVAELAVLVRTAHAAADGIEIQPKDLPSWLRQAESSLNSPRTPPPAIDLDQQLCEIERELLSRALRLAGGNKSQAAKLVGWTRQRLLRRGEELGLLRPATEKAAANEPEFIPDLPFEPEEE